MTGNATLTALLFAFLIQSVFTFSLYGQGAEIKESGLQLHISSNSFSTSFYVFECGYGISDWKDVIDEDICAPLVWIGNSDSSGCTDNGIPLAGKIAVIWEGGCSVATKAVFAQQTGALAVLIAGKSDPQYPPVSRYTLGLENELPAVQIPVFYLSPSDFQHVNMAFQSGSEVMACLKRPAVFLNNVAYPSNEIQQHCLTPIEPFHFSVSLSNLSGTDLQNVTINAVLQHENGQEVFSSELFLPEIKASVTDSLYLFSDIFDQINMSPGVHQVLYTVQGSLNGIPYVDIRNVKFNSKTTRLAKELTGLRVAYRPDTIPELGWTIANLYYSGNSLDWLKATGVEISVLPGDEMGVSGTFSVALSLFELNEDVFPDFSNFEPDGSSMTWVGAGSITADLSENETYLMGEIIDLNTAVPGVLFENDKYYLIAASFEGDNKYLYQGFGEEHTDGKIGTLMKTNEAWHVSNFYGNPNPVLRLYLDNEGLFCPTTDANEPTRINFKISPNPVQDYLTLQMAFEESTDAFITFFDINGRVITVDSRKGLIDDKLTYPASKFTNGANIVRVTTQKGSETKMFVVQKE